MTKLDARSGYWQMELDAESQQFVTFITPFGRFAPTKGPFGLVTLPEIFSRKMDEVVKGLHGIAKSMDDFLVYGKTVIEHDRHLRIFLQNLEEYGVTLNLEKCEFTKEEVEFLGYVIPEKE